MRGIRALAGILSLLFLSCGGGSWGKDDARFVNRTNLAEAEFQTMAEQRWQEAQAAIATHPFDLHAAVPDRGAYIVPADHHALNIEPRNVVIQSQPDIAAEVLNAVPNCAHCPYTDPTGIVRCGEKFCYAYLRDLCTIVVPASSPQNMGPYEMENCILW